MRKNTRLLLFVLWCLRSEFNCSVSYSLIYRLFAQLSEGGVRSTLKLLVDDNFVNINSDDDGRKKIGISNKGIKWVEQEYLLFTDDLVIDLLLLPSADKKTKLLLQNAQGVMLRRGVWMLQRQQLTSPKLARMIKKNNGLVFALLGSNISDSFLPQFLQQKKLLDRENKYWRSISIQIRVLIEKISIKKDANKRDFTSFYTLVTLIDDRLRSFCYRYWYQTKYLHPSVSQAVSDYVILARIYQSK